METRSLQAKKQQLSSSVDALTKSLATVHDGIETERKRRLAEAEAELKKLQDKQRALKKDNARLDQENTELMRALAAAERRLDGLNDDIAGKQQALARLETTRDVLEEELAKLKDSINTQSGLVPGIQEQISARQKELEAVEAKIAFAAGQLDDLQADYDTRKARLDDELKAILLKTQDKLIQYKQLSEEEDSIRKAIASDRLKLQKEREVLERAGSKLSQAEAKINKQRSFLRL